MYLRSWKLRGRNYGYNHAHVTSAENILTICLIPLKNMATPSPALNHFRSFNPSPDLTSMATMATDVVAKPQGAGFDGEARSSNQSNVLSTINEAKFSWFHVKAILISGVGQVYLSSYIYTQNNFFSP